MSPLPSAKLVARVYNRPLPFASLLCRGSKSIAKRLSYRHLKTMQRDAKEIICIGSVLWDIIGRSPREMRAGNDMPGRITRIPGGVAMNIAMTLARFGLSPVLLSALGRDAAGAELVRAGKDLGLVCDYIHFSQRPTDAYMAIEGANGLIAAIADAHSLEAAGDAILAPLFNGTLGSTQAPYSGPIALDGNLTVALLDDIASSADFADADLRVAPASPGKAQRLLPFIKNSRAVLYVNLEEAVLLCQSEFADAALAAQALLDRGAARVLVTNGAQKTADGSKDGIITQQPAQVLVTRVTGAGDTFMAAHIVAEARGASRETALEKALDAAATYVSGESPS